VVPSPAAPWSLRQPAAGKGAIVADDAG
jgi:hypothetical protein